MPHINYARGETREFVVRRNNWSTRANWLWRGHYRMRRRKKTGMGKRYQVKLGFGIRNWCPCCQPGNPHDPYWKRAANRLDRIEGKRECQEGYEEWLADLEEGIR